MMTTAIIPIPRCAVGVRLATATDLPFIDRLQKLHAKQVGWMPTQQLEGKIAAGQTIVAWASRPCSSQDMAGTAMLREEPVGYCIGQDQYFKRDDVGIIYQMNVVPGAQRKLIGATLLMTMFERAAYGCRLFCCWCAQDIEANYFWESLGFVPLAFRAGSREKVKGGRVHIFWQRRIRAGDCVTPYWFPAQTSAGSIREDRLVLPIPPGMHWRDVRGLGILPEQKFAAPRDDAGHRCSGETPKPHLKPQVPTRRRVQFGPPSSAEQGGQQAGPGGAVAEAETVVVNAKPKRERKSGAKAKNDPKLLAAARELRDRWLEQVNAPGGASVLVEAGRGKYDVSRALPDKTIAMPGRGCAQALPQSLPQALPAPRAA
jgi:GNAT superfamily N-acetyltransferase